MRYQRARYSVVLRARRTWPRWPLIVAAALVGAAVPRASRAVSTFTVIPAIPGVSEAPEATAISADGQVVVGSQFLHPEYGSTYEGFRWTEADGTMPLGGTPGALLNTYPQAVSADGSVVAGYTPGAGADAAFRWTGSEGAVSIGTLPGTLYSLPRDVSGDGDVVVGTSYTDDSDVSEAFRWTQADGMVGLGDLPGVWFRSEATGVSADGAVVVGQGVTVQPGHPLYFQAFRWTADDGMVGLGSLTGGSFSGANDVSADGGAVVGVSSGTQGYEAFLWTETDGMIGLGDLSGGSFRSEAFAVSGDGSVGVGASSGTNVFLGPTGTIFEAPEAFVWDAAHGMRSIQKLLESEGIGLPFDLHRAIDVSADGTVILGTSEVGFYPNLRTVSWIATMPAIPEPSTALLLMCGLFALARRRARQLAPAAKSLRGRDREVI